MTLPDSSRIVITGGSGFIGSNLLKVKLFHNSLAIGRTPLKTCLFSENFFVRRL